MSDDAANNILLIGPGKIGLVFSRLIARHGDKLAGVIGSSLQSAERRLEAILVEMPTGSRPSVYQSIELALKHQSVDGIIICAPESSRQTYLSQALDTGLPILCEKPLFGTSIDKGFCSGLLAQHREAPFVFNASNHVLTREIKDFASIAREKQDFQFRFHTNGSQKFLDIVQDLMPHCISVLQKTFGYQNVALSDVEVNEHWVTGSFEYGKHKVSFDFAERASLEKALVFGPVGHVFRRVQQGQGESYRVFMAGPLPDMNAPVGAAALIEHQDPFINSYQRFRSMMHQMDHGESDLGWALENYELCQTLLQQCSERLGQGVQGKHGA